MFAVGVDVSKGKSMVTIITQGYKPVMRPKEFKHTVSELGNLADIIKGYGPDTKVVMENTGFYHCPLLNTLKKKGIYVSAINAKLIHDYNRGNSLRKIKTDKADAKKIADYALDNWDNLPQYTGMDTIRIQLKTLNHQYTLYTKVCTELKNSFIAILDQTFPGVNTLFTSDARPDGSQKWVDFAAKFWHADMVKHLTLEGFTKKYQKFCKENKYCYRNGDAEKIYAYAQEAVCSFPCDDTTAAIIKASSSSLQAASKSVAEIKAQMLAMAETLPEFDVVMNMGGVGETLAPQLIAEIGDIAKFKSRGAIVAYAGVDPRPKHDSGSVNYKSNKISKTGSPYLRRTLFLVMSALLMKMPADDPVYQFMDKKRAEGKEYLVYTTAGANKFLRIYYARVREKMAEVEAAKAANTEASQMS